MLTDDFARHQATRGFSQATIDRRTVTLRSFARMIAPSDLRSATHDDIEMFLSSKTAPRTRHAYRSDLRTFYSWAQRRGHVEIDPTKDIESIKVPKSLPRPLHGELDALLLVGRRRTRRMTALGFYAGLRCAEIATLDASDVMTHTDPKVIVVRNGKGGKDRVVPMHPILAELFADLPSSGPLFINPRTGRPVKPKTVGAAITRHLRSCGIAGVPHQLRHSFGTEFARRAKGNLLIVAQAMGHESLKTTQGYVAFDGGAAAAIIDQLYGGDEAA